MHEEKLSTENNEVRDSKNINPNKQRTLIKEDKQMYEKKITHKIGNGNDASEMELKMLDNNSLEIPKHYPRTDLGDIEKLQGSFRREGTLNTLLVREIGEGRYEIVDGVRSFEAAKGLGRKEVPCLIIKGLTDDQAAHLAYVKNVERKSYNPIEKARHIKTMRDVFGYTLDELELKGYGSRSAISNKLKLLDLSDKVQRKIQAGTLTAAHGLPLTKLNTREEQERMAKRIEDFDLTARVTEDRIDRYLAKKRKKKKVGPKEIIPSNDVPGVYFKDARNMSELPDELVQLTHLFD